MADAIEMFFQQVGKTELLTREQEVDLAQRIESGDRRARDRMIRANLRLAISLAKQFQNRGSSLEDLIQESSLGLIKAVDRFDWRKGFKFSTYACWWIKQSIRQHVASHSAPLKLPTYAKNMMFKIQQATSDYNEAFGQHPSTEEIAEALGTTTDTIMTIIACSAPGVSMDSVPRSNRNVDGNGKTLGEMIEDASDHIDDVLDKQKILPVIRRALQSLTPREEKVLRLRFGIYEDLDDGDYCLSDEERRRLYGADDLEVRVVGGAQ
jgi:RNA polymerase primary sigma factor